MTIPDELAEIERRFSSRLPIGDQPTRYALLRDCARELATEIIGRCPPGRERSVALIKVEEAVMWAHAAIQRED